MPKFSLGMGTHVIERSRVGWTGKEVESVPGEAGDKMESANGKLRSYLESRKFMCIRMDVGAK